MEKEKKESLLNTRFSLKRDFDFISDKDYRISITGIMSTVGMYLENPLASYKTVLLEYISNKIDEIDKQLGI